MFSTIATRFFERPTYSTTVEVSHQNLLTIRIQCSVLSKRNKISLCSKRCAATIKTQISPYDPSNLAIFSNLRPENGFISNWGQNFKKTVSSDDFVHFIDEENILTYVDFHGGFTFYPESPTKMRHINRERKYISTA